MFMGKGKDVDVLRWERQRVPSGPFTPAAPPSATWQVVPGFARVPIARLRPADIEQIGQPPKPAVA
jgi:hypothetical protein